MSKVLHHFAWGQTGGGTMDVIVANCRQDALDELGPDYVKWYETDPYAPGATEGNETDTVYIVAKDSPARENAVGMAFLLEGFPQMSEADKEAAQALWGRHLQHWFFPVSLTDQAANDDWIKMSEGTEP